MPHDDGSPTYLEVMESVDYTLEALLRHVHEPTPAMINHVKVLRSYLYGIITVARRDEQKRERRLQ